MQEPFNLKAAKCIYQANDGRTLEYIAHTDWTGDIGFAVFFKDKRISYIPHPVQPSVDISIVLLSMMDSGFIPKVT